MSSGTDAKHLHKQSCQKGDIVSYTMDTYPKKLSCSKKVVIVSFLIMVALVGATVYGVFFEICPCRYHIGSANDISGL